MSITPSTAYVCLPRDHMVLQAEEQSFASTTTSRTDADKDRQRRGRPKQTDRVARAEKRVCEAVFRPSRHSHLHKSVYPKIQGTHSEHTRSKKC